MFCTNPNKSQNNILCGLWCCTQYGVKHVEVEIKIYVKMMLCMVCGLAYMHQIYDTIFVCHLEAST